MESRPAAGARGKSFMSQFKSMSPIDLFLIIGIVIVSVIVLVILVTRTSSDKSMYDQSDSQMQNTPYVNEETTDPTTDPNSLDQTSPTAIPEQTTLDNITIESADSDLQSVEQDINSL